MKIKELLPQLTGLKGAILDVDGTILDTMKAWEDVDYKYLESLGIEAPPGLHDIFFSMTLDESTKYIKERFKLDFTEEEVAEGIFSIIRSFYRDEAPLKPGIKELLEFLRSQGTKMSIVTSSERELIEPGFKRLGIDSYFEGFYTCTELKTSKKEPWIFNHAAEQMGLMPEDIVVFEDGLYVMEVVKKEGFGVVGFYDESSKGAWDDIQKIADRAIKE